MAICLCLADRLTSQYGSDADIADVVDNRRLWLVPCVNPDGYYYSHDQGHRWRGNRRHFAAEDRWGVDPNRNYRGSESGDPWGAWGSVGPASARYGGEFPESEPEIQAVCRVFRDNDITAAITWHTFAECVMWPWAYSRDARAPDDEYLAEVGREIASRIDRQEGDGTYRAFQTSRLTLVAGETTDWAYGCAHYLQGRTTFAYTIEACREFAPTDDKLPQICAENIDGALYLLSEAGRIRDTVVPRVMPPVFDDVGVDSDGDFMVSWKERNPRAAADRFQLDELTDLSILTDGAESGSVLWDLDGFSTSKSKHHSSGHSYRASHKGRRVSSMTTVYPIPAAEGLTLSFWCLHDLKKNRDGAFVEVSRDGRSFDILDRFTGSSGEWLHREYDLSDYAGESIFLRFRHATYGDPEGGFFVDDISPVPRFGTIETLSDSIVLSWREVTGRAEGDYCYRVRGHNPERGWGDFSTLKRVNRSQEESGGVK